MADDVLMEAGIPGGIIEARTRMRTLCLELARTGQSDVAALLWWYDGIVAMQQAQIEELHRRVAALEKRDG